MTFQNKCCVMSDKLLLNIGPKPGGYASGGQVQGVGKARRADHTMKAGNNRIQKSGDDYDFGYMVG
jgi:hypothetical protein